MEPNEKEKQEETKEIVEAPKVEEPKKVEISEVVKANKPKGKGMHIAIHALILIAVIALVGGATYYVMNQKAIDQKAQSDVENADLQSQIDEIVAEEEEDVADAKKVKEAGDKLVEYKDSDYNLSFKYPKKWGEVVTEDGKMSTPASGNYFQLGFSKASKITINLVEGPWTSPLDGCAFATQVVTAAEYGDNMLQSAVVGFKGDKIQYLTTDLYKPDYDNSTTSTLDTTKTATPQSSYVLQGTSGDVMIFKDIFENKAVADGAGPCISEITQAAADKANEYNNKFYYAVNFSNTEVEGVNAVYDSRKEDNKVEREELLKVLKSIK